MRGECEQLEAVAQSRAADIDTLAATSRDFEQQLTESQRMQDELNESQERLQEELVAERAASSAAEARLSAVQQEAQARRNGMAEAKKQMKLLIEENTLLRAQHEQIQRALAPPTQIEQSKPVLVHQPAHFPPMELNEQSDPPLPVVTEQSSECEVAPLGDSTTSPESLAQIEESTDNAVAANAPTKPVALSEPSDAQVVPTKDEHTDEGDEQREQDSVMSEPDREPEVDEPIAPAAEEATEPAAVAPKANEETAAPQTRTLDTPAAEEPTPEQPPLDQTPTAQSTPKLGAGFGPQGSTARAYFLLFLQATLAVLTIGILTGGCRITVQHGATDHLHRVASTYGGTRLALTL